MSALTAEDRTFIEEAQPFKAGEPWKKLEPLTILQELNNADKHRLFHASFVCRFVGVMRYEPEPMQYWVPVGPTLDDFVKASLGKATSFSGIQFPGLFIMPRPIQDIAQAPPVGTFAETTDDRTEIMRIPIVASGPNPQMEVQHSPPPLDISLGDREFPATLATLGAIRQRVHEVVDHFRPLFS